MTNPQHTDLATQILRVQTLQLTHRHNLTARSRERERSTTWPTVIYSSGVSNSLVQNIPEPKYLDIHVTNHYTKYTSDRDLLTFLEIIISKMNHTYKTHHNSK